MSTVKLGVILAVAKVLAAVRTEHTFTALTAEMAAIKRLVVAEAEIIRTSRAELVLAYLAGKMSAAKRGVVTTAKVAKTAHTFSVLASKTSVMSAIQQLVVIKAGVAATAWADSVIHILIGTDGMSALAVAMVARTHISGTEGTLIVITVLASVVTASEHSVFTDFKVFATNLTIVYYRFTAGRVVTRAEFFAAISAISMLAVHTSGVAAIKDGVIPARASAVSATEQLVVVAVASKMPAGEKIVLSVVALKVTAIAISVSSLLAREMSALQEVM